MNIPDDGLQTRSSTPDPLAKPIPRKPVCPHCDSANVVADAAARWDVETQTWEVSNVFGKGNGCDDCGAMDIEFKWLDDDEQRTATPRRNDMLATELVAIVTTGHVTRAEAQILDAYGYSRGEYGWLLSLRPPQSPVVPEIAGPSASLTGVIEQAREQGCSYLLFDRDAEALEGVATHGW